MASVRLCRKGLQAAGSWANIGDQQDTGKWRAGMWASGQKPGSRGLPTALSAGELGWATCGLCSISSMANQPLKTYIHTNNEKHLSSN